MSHILCVEDESLLESKKSTKKRTRSLSPHDLSKKFKIGRNKNKDPLQNAKHQNPNIDNNIKEEAKPSVHRTLSSPSLNDPVNKRFHCQYEPVKKRAKLTMIEYVECPFTPTVEYSEKQDSLHEKKRKYKIF